MKGEASESTPLSPFDFNRSSAVSSDELLKSSSLELRDGKTSRVKVKAIV